MLAVSSINFNQKRQLKSSKSNVAFAARINPEKVVDKKLGMFLCDFFDTDFGKIGNKFTSDDAFSYRAIEEWAEDFEDMIEFKGKRLSIFKTEKDLPALSKKAYDYSLFDSLYFAGPDGEVCRSPEGGLHGAGMALMKGRPGKINPTFISDEMKDILEKKFKSNGEMIRTRYGRENFIIKNERIDPENPNSPIWRLIVEKVWPKAQ